MTGGESISAIFRRLIFLQREIDDEVEIYSALTSASIASARPIAALFGYAAPQPVPGRDAISCWRVLTRHYSRCRVASHTPLPLNESSRATDDEGRWARLRFRYCRYGMSCDIEA